MEHQEIQEILGVSVPSEGNGVVTKRLNHNASERDRHKKIKSLFSSLRSCLPASDPVSSYSAITYINQSRAQAFEKGICLGLPNFVEILGSQITKKKKKLLHGS